MLLGAALILVPLVDGASLAGLLLELGVVIAIVGAVSRLPQSRVVTGLIVVVAIISEVGSFMNARGAEPLWIVVDMAFGMMLILLVIAVITANVWRLTEVTADTILGGLAVYVLLGAVWATAFQLLEFVQPGSFLVLADSGSWGPWQPEPGRFPRLFFLSFVTLTTLGYGDVVPSSISAGILTSTEAIVGPVYLTVLIARLVALEVAKSTRERREAPAPTERERE
jgi:hypothetical protein